MMACSSVLNVPHTLDFNPNVGIFLKIGNFTDVGVMVPGKNPFVIYCQNLVMFSSIVLIMSSAWMLKSGKVLI